MIRDGDGRVLLIRRGDADEWALPAGIMEMEDAIDVAYFAPEALPPLRPGHHLRISDALSQQREAYYR